MADLKGGRRVITTALGVTAIVAGMYFIRPCAIPTLLIFSALFPVKDASISWDVVVLSGVILGIALDILVHKDLSRLNRLMTPIWIPFLAFALILVLSALSNGVLYEQSEQAKLFSDTKWFVFRMTLLATVTLSLRGESFHVSAWNRPLIFAGLLLVLLRLLQVADVQLVSQIFDHWNLQVLSDLRQEGWFNGYGSYLALILPLTLGEAVKLRNTLFGHAFWGIAFLLIIGFWGVQSRTAAVIIVIELLVSFFVFNSSVWSRFMLGVLGVTFIAVTILDPTFVSKNSLMAQTVRSFTQRGFDITDLRVLPRDSATEAAPTNASIGRNSTATNTVVSLEDLKSSAWRAPLVEENHRLRQRVKVSSSRTDHILYIFLRRTVGARQTKLQVYADGRLVATVADLPEEKFDWVSVPLPSNGLRGEWATVELAASGQLDSMSNYIEIGGLDVQTPELASSYSNGDWNWRGDLSWDAGQQQGIFLILLDSKEIRNASPLGTPSGRNLDQSLSDRLALWRAALKIATSHPWLGTGYYTFGKVSGNVLKDAPHFVVYANAHSSFLQVAADLGIPGLLFFTLMFVVSLVVLRNRLKRVGNDDVPALSTGLAVLSLALSSLTQTWLADVRYYTSAWIVLGTVACLHLEQSKPVSLLRWLKGRM